MMASMSQSVSLLEGPSTVSECCTLSSGPIEAHEATRLAEMFKALADPTRLRLLSHIAAQGCDSVCACDLLDVLDVSQPTVSHHLKKLVDTGLLSREQRGKWAHYSIVQNVVEELQWFLSAR